MKLFKNKEDLHKAIVVFLIIAASILFACAVYNFDVIWGGIKMILGFFTPFYIGFVIAYLLNPVQEFLEHKVYHKIKKESRRLMLGILTTIIIFVGVIFLLLYFIIPNLISSISTLVSGIPANIKALTSALANFTERYPVLQDLYSQYGNKFTDLITNTIKTVAGALSSLFPSVVNVTVSITSGIADFFIGFVIAMYMLISKDNLIAQCKKVLFCTFSEKNANRLIGLAQLANKKMSNYLVGQLSISLIDASVVYLVSMILGFPYPVLLAVIVALFNLIPFFGSIIGCIPCLFIILIQSPIKALYFLIFFIILQQIEGNIISPKIQGKQLNIGAIWIIFAILLFGGLFGFLGLLIGVPLFAVLYMLFSRFINDTLRKKGLSTDTEDYIKKN